MFRSVVTIFLNFEVALLGHSLVHCIISSRQRKIGAVRKLLNPSVEQRQGMSPRNPKLLFSNDSLGLFARPWFGTLYY